MSRSSHTAGCLVAAVLSLQPWAAAQAPEAGRVEIVFPPEGSYVSGVLTVKVAVAGESVVARRIQIFADGTLLCVVETEPFECSWDAGESVREHRLRVVAELADGRRLIRNARTAAVGYAEHVDVEAVLVPVLVSDGEGFVRGLGKSAFKVFEDGTPQQINTVSADNVALDLVVAVDISESMAPSLARVKQAVKGFLQSLRPDDRVTLLAFNENVFTLSRRDATAEALHRSLDRLAPWGGTALYDVLIKGMDLLTRATGRRALVVFTDGYDQSSRSSLDSALRAVEAGDAAVYPIVLGGTPEARHSRKTVERLAQLSGGRAFFRNDVGDLDGDFAKITEELFNQYLLAYSSTNPRRDETWRKIKVEVTGSKYTVRARHGYRAVARQSGSQP